MISRRLFLKAAGAILGAAALPHPVASAAGATPELPVMLPGGTMRFLDASGSCVVAVPLTLERLPDALCFRGQGIAFASGTVASCTWTLPNGRNIPASVGLGWDDDIKLGTSDFLPGFTLGIDGKITFDGPPVGGRFFALECYRSFLGSEGLP
jgi:hypothetical protein